MWKEAIWQSWVVLGALCPTLLQLIAQLTFIALFSPFWLRLPQKPKPCRCITGVNWLNGAFVKSLLTLAGVNLSQFTWCAFPKSSYASSPMSGPKLHETLRSKKYTPPKLHTGSEAKDRRFIFLESDQCFWSNDKPMLRQMDCYNHQTCLQARPSTLKCTYSLPMTNRLCLILGAELAIVFKMR